MAATAKVWSDDEDVIRLLQRITNFKHEKWIDASTDMAVFL